MGDDSRFPDAVQQPTYPQFTNLALNEGLVDQLMATVNHHLDEQYRKGRLTGSDFAQVYVGSLQSVMQYSTQYLLGTLLIDEQKAKSLAEIALLVKQGRQADVQIEMIELQKQELRYRIEQLLPLEKQQLELQNAKLVQEALLVAAQVSLTDAQKLKIDKEIEFLTAKILTENANTQSGIATADSLIGRQMSLLLAQKLGFAGDIQVKAAKVHADYDAVFQGVQEVPADVLLHPPATALLSKADTTATAIGSA